MAHMYERYLRLLKKWPVLAGRQSSCLGQHIRDRGKKVFTKQGELIGNIQDCELRMQSLERLANNHWRDKYPRSRQSSALNLPAELCGHALTRQFAEEWIEYNKPLINRIFVRAVKHLPFSLKWAAEKREKEEKEKNQTL